MKIILYLVLVVLLTISYSSTAAENSSGEYEKPEHIRELRETFYKAVENESEIDSLKSLIITRYSQDTSQYPPVVLAYWGGIEALKSKHAFWPYTKYSRFKASMNIFEQAVNKAPEDLEIRFLRFSILHHVPGILGYGEERQNDAEMIVDLLLKKEKFDIDQELRKNIVDFMLHSERLTKNQEDALTNKFTFAVNE